MKALPEIYTINDIKKTAILCLKLTLFFGVFFSIVFRQTSLNGISWSFLISAMYCFGIGFGNGFINNYLSKKWHWVSDTNKRVWAGIIATTLYTIPVVLSINYLVFIVINNGTSSQFFRGSYLWAHLFYFLLSITVSALTGERTNFLIRACGGMLASIIWKPKFIMISMLILIEVLAILILFLHRPDLSDRFGKQLINAIPLTNTSDNNPYWGAWRGGIQQGLLKPIKGIGPSGTRNTCATLDTSLPKWLPGKNYCGNHPHNFYVQLFAETGIVGLLIGCIMFASITLNCYRARKYNFEWCTIFCVYGLAILRKMDGYDYEKRHWVG